MDARTSISPLISLVGALTLGLAGPGCSGDDRAPIGSAPKPTIERFDADPTVVAPGQTTMLSYRVVGATRLRIETEAGDSVLPETTATEGEKSVVSNALMATTTFVLVAENAAGASMSSVTVTVDDPNAPRIEAFTATPEAINEGDSTTLRWQSRNGVGARIEVDGNQVHGVPAEAVAAGEWTTNPAQTTTYTFVLVTNDGSLLQESLTVTVTPQGGGPIVQSFTATPDTITEGETATLGWAVELGNLVLVTDDAQNTVYTGSDLTGSQAVQPTQTTTYRLEVQDGNGGSANRSVTVTVNPINPGAARIDAFAASPATIDAGDSSTLSWTAQDAPGGVRIEAGGQTVHTDTNLNGSFVVTPAVTTEYTLVAINPAGDAQRMTTVTVNPAPDPSVTNFAASATTVALGGAVDLTWATQDADAVRILRDGVEVFSTTASAAAGNAAVTVPNPTTVFTLEATAANRPAAHATVTVYGHPTPVINAFTVTPTVIRGPTAVTVSWDVQGLASLTLTQDGGAVAGFGPVASSTAAIDSQGSLQVMLSAGATFELVATSAAGQANQTAQVALVTAIPEVEPNDTVAGAQAVAGTVTINGNLTADDVDIYRVTVGEGGNVFAETSDGQGGCATDTVLILADATGATITVDDNTGTGNCSRIDPTADSAAGDLAAGDYLIGVVHQSPTGTGAYTLDVRVGTPSCGNGVTEGRINEQCDFGDTVNGDGCSSTCQLEIHPTVVTAPGANVQVNLPTPNAIAVIRVDVTGGQSITATAADAGGRTCNNVDTAINLGDSTFGLLGSKADGGPSGAAGDCATIRFPEDRFATDLPAGSYYLVVFNSGTSGGGAVEVRVGVNSPVCGNGVVELNANEQCDNTGGAGAVPCDASCQVQTAGAATLPAAGPQLFTGSIASGFVLYRVDVTQEIYLRAETFAPNQAAGCNVDTAIELYDEFFRFVGGDNDSGTNSCSRLNEDFAFTRLQPGRYWLLVAEPALGALGTYQLSLDALLVGPGAPTMDAEPNDTQADAQDTGLTGVGSVILQGALDPSGDDDVYRLQIPANTSLTLNTRTFDTYASPNTCTASNAVADTRLFLELAGVEATGPNTGEIAYSDDISGTQWCSQISGRVLAGGANGATYFLRVQGYNDTGVRQYFLQVTLQ